jgi:DHA1 family bicyclomycin/chloramphenicol resistance-like MFS transporter
MAIGPLSIDLYIPSFADIAENLGVNTAEIGYSLTSYFFGLLIGQFIYGTLIDRFGRKKPLLIGLVIYVFASLSCALAPTLGWLVGSRLIMALGGCAGMVVSRAVVRDVFNPKDISKVFSQLMLVMGIAPIIAPSLGGFINSWLGWRWIFGTTALIGVTIFIVVLTILKETKGPDSTVSLKPRKIFSEYGALLINKEFLTYSLAGSFGFAGLFAYISGSPALFLEKYHFTDTQFSYAFAFNASGLILGSQFNRIIIKHFNELTISKWTATILFGVGSFLFGISLTGLDNAALLLSSTFIFLFLLGILNPNTQALALMPFGKQAGRSSALLGGIQMGVGVFVSWLVSYLHSSPIPAMAFGMLLCVFVSFAILISAKYLPVLVTE